MQKNPDILSPVGPQYNVTYRVLYNIFDLLVGVDFENDFRLRPSLATEWRRIDDLTMELTLRRGVKFHDGAEMTAEDVVFSFGPERVMNEDAPGHKDSRPFLGTFDKVEAIDDYTVRVTTKKPDPILHLRLAGWMSQIIRKDAYLAAPGFDAWAKKPIGTGPYKVVDFAQDEYILLAAHDDYWGGRPPFKQVRFQVVPELATRIAGLSTGEFDIVTEVPPDQFATIEGFDCCSVVGGAINNTRLVNFTKNNPVMRNADVRRAMALAVDRELIVDSLWGGRIDIPPGLQSKSFGELYLADFPAPAYDPDAARKLLAKAGYKGEEIPFQVLEGYYTSQVETAQALVEMWRAVGLNVKLDVKENWGQILTDKPAHFTDYSSTDLYPDPVASIVRNYGPDSYVQKIDMWSNDEFNKLSRVVATEIDADARKTALRRMLEIFHRDDPGALVLHKMGMFYGKNDAVAWEPYRVVYMDLGPLNPAFSR